jgi:hypothetical protein
MDSIPEDDVSSLNSEDRQVITQFLSSDDEQEDSFSSPKKCSNTASSTDGWGRVRSTQRWPTTPESKSSSSNPNNFRQPMLAPLESTATGAEEKLAEITAPTNAIDDRMETISEDDIQRKKASLTAILRALSTRFESVGYCQGMDRIVVHVMRAARCAVSLRSVPFGDLPRRDEITEERTRQCYSFLEAIFLRLSLSGNSSLSSLGPHPHPPRDLLSGTSVWPSPEDLSDDSSPGSLLSGVAENSSE